MNREVHVRFRERLRGKFPRATRPGIVQGGHFQRLLQVCQRGLGIRSAGKRVIG